MTDQTKVDESIPRGGGDVSGKGVTEIPRGGGDVSGKMLPTDQENERSTDDPQSKEIHQSAKV